MSATRPRLNFFIDHNVAESTARSFEAAGHTVRRLRTVIPSDSPDALVAAIAAASGEILVTHDLDFRAAAKRTGISKSVQRKLSKIQLSCRETEAAGRVTAAMSLIEHEWTYAIAFGIGILRIDINTSIIRIER